jgi:hypothetical protein
MIYAVVAYALAGLLWIAYFASLRGRAARVRRHREQDR